MPYETADELNRITAAVVGAAIDVHRELGPGLFENAYLPCLCYELGSAGMTFALQAPIPLTYRTVRLDCAYRADLIVEGAVIVEVKALESLAAIHSHQLYTYLRLADRRVGLILNFGASTMKAGIRRIVNGFPLA